jgi:hypothetical protein
MSKKILPYSILLLFLSNSIGKAQGFLGISSQFWGGIHNTYQNPAFIPQESGIRVHFIMAGVHLDNNYVGYAAPFSMLDLLQGKNNRPLDPNDLEEIRDGKPKNTSLSTELRGPALSLTIGKNTHLAVMSRVRSGFQITEASERLMGIARLGLANADNLQNLGYLALYASQSENKFNLTSQAYSEWAVSLGQVLTESDDSRLTGGVTIKRYFGYAAGYMQNQSLNYRLLPDSSTSNAAYMQVDRFEATMGYTDVNRSSFLSPGWLFGSNASGKGWGWDIGFSYEALSDTERQPAFRLSASVTDIGKMTYQGEKVKNYSILAEDRQITEEEWRGYSTPREGENQLNAFGRLFEEEFGLKDENNTGNFAIAAPTALNISADLRLVEHFHVNTTLIQSIGRSALPEWRMSSLWAVIPRYETSKVGLAIPIVRQNSAWAFGATLRLGPLLVGSDNLLGVFSRNGKIKAQGVDIYAGLSLGIGKQKK